MSYNRLLEQVKQRFNIGEDGEGNTTSSIEPLTTPNTFTDEVEDPEDDAYSIRVDEWFNKVNNSIERLNELSYKDFKSDSSSNERQKINKLREVEQMVVHAHKLKNESGQDSGVFWKRTQGSFVKIKERLNRLTNKIVEITG